jgi:hypothetical protein
MESEVSAALKRLSTLVCLKKGLSEADLMAAEEKLVEFKECISARGGGSNAKGYTTAPMPSWELFVKLTDADVTARLKRVEKKLKCRPNMSATDRHKYESERLDLIRRLKYATKVGNARSMATVAI